MGTKKSKPKRGSRYENDTAATDLASGLQTADNEVRSFRQVHEDRVSCLATYKPGVCMSGSSDTVSNSKNNDNMLTSCRCFSLVL